MGGIAVTNRMTTQEASVIDLRVLEGLEKNIGREMMLRLIGLFREAELRRAPLLEAACKNSDFSALRRIAHDLVSDAAVIGAKTLSDAARRIESGALAGDGKTFDEATELQRIGRDVEAALTALAGKEK